MLLWVENGENRGAHGFISLPYGDPQMSNMGMCSPYSAPPIHRRHQPSSMPVLSSQKGSFTRTAGMQHCFQLPTLSHVRLKHAPHSRRRGKTQPHATDPFLGNPSSRARGAGASLLLHGTCESITTHRTRVTHRTTATSIPRQPGALRGSEGWERLGDLHTPVPGFAFHGRHSGLSSPPHRCLHSCRLDPATQQP